MVDCLFENNRHLHLHVSEPRRSATLVSHYRPGAHASHAEDLRQGRESEGRLREPGASRFLIELFLLNAPLGEKPGEVVVVRVDADGRSRMEARAGDGSRRVIDYGTCSDRPAGGG